jgi:hypothetical protein
MSYLRYVCLFAYSCVQRILCCVFFVFVLCDGFSGLSIFTTPLVFSNVYSQYEQHGPYQNGDELAKGKQSIE